jgi:two-component system phosphate regulon sensor histidine kinase PhoR
LLRDAVENSIESAREIEITPEGATEPRIFQAQTAFVRSEDERQAVIGVVAIFNDITEIRNVERMKTAFVSTVSHELRTPLTSIKGFISTLLQDTDGYYDAETRTEFYQIIDSECDRLQRLIEDLLNVSRIESGRALQINWGLFEPLPIMEKVVHAQGSYTDKHRFRVEVEGTLPTVLGDSDKFDQIITNLLSNAVKYSPSGGDIVVRASSDDEMLRVSVTDNGIGIPASKLSRIWEKFERVDDRDTRSAGGTGIGLFLVKHLVERHEGTIHVESELGKGSVFSFEIPLHPLQADQEMKQLDENASLRFGAH